MKNILTKDEAKKIAFLAYLNLTDSQTASLAESMSSIINHMEEIKDLNLENVPETSRMTEETNTTREDVVEPSFTQEEAISGAKRTYNGYFVVPYVFKEDE